MVKEAGRSWGCAGHTDSMAQVWAGTQVPAGVNGPTARVSILVSTDSGYLIHSTSSWHFTLCAQLRYVGCWGGSFSHQGMHISNVRDSIYYFLKARRDQVLSSLKLQDVQILAQMLTIHITGPIMNTSQLMYYLSDVHKRHHATWHYQGVSHYIVIQPAFFE